MTFSQPTPEANIQPRLGLWDTVSIIVGIVVGTTIYRGTASIFAYASGPWTTLGLWIAGGLLAWCGAVCYAELATTYPRDGGDYEYLNRAFGPWSGFLFAWAQITTIISGNIAIMAYAFADYAAHLWPNAGRHTLALTVNPIIALSLLNAAGVAAGKTVQNLLTVAKVLGLIGLVVAGVVAMNMHPTVPFPPPPMGPNRNLGLALVFVLYAYGGWAHAAYVAAEVRDQRRNLPRALVLGIVGITIVYLAVNAAYLAALGYGHARATTTPAADTLGVVAGRWGDDFISILVMISALGAINGMILTGTRVYATWGADYPAFRWLSAWNRRSAAPVAAIAVQGLIAIAILCLVGTSTGRAMFDAPLKLVTENGLPWDDFAGGYEILVVGSAPVYWALCLATGVAVVVLRFKDRNIERPYRIPFFPLPVIAFCVTCVFMLYSAQAYARWLTLLGIVPLVMGGIVCLFVRRKSAAKP